MKRSARRAIQIGVLASLQQVATRLSYRVIAPFVQTPLFIVNYLRRRPQLDLLVSRTRANVWCLEDTMTNYSHILFNKSPEQLRRMGARGGKAYGRNKRARRILMPTPAQPTVPRAAPRHLFDALPARLQRFQPVNQPRLQQCSRASSRGGRRRRVGLYSAPPPHHASVEVPTLLRELL